MFSCTVNALNAIRKSLYDPMDNLKNWNKGDPCTSNWTGIWCNYSVANDNYLHISEMYVQYFLFLKKL